MNKNDIVTLSITAVSNEGYGIGRADNTVVFVPFAAIGDKIEVLIVKVKKNFCFGKILKFIEKSSDRITPDCDVFSRCGGCAYRHISYTAEKQIKRQRVTDCITRIGGLDATVHAVTSNDITDCYRNKSQYPVGKNDFGTVSGFYALHSHRIVECEKCSLTDPVFDEIRVAVLDFANKNHIAPFDEQTHKGVLRHIYIRKATATGEIMVCLIINADEIENEQKLVDLLCSFNKNIRTIAVNINKNRSNVILGQTTRILYGDGYIEDILCGLKFRIGVQSFYQVNRDMAQLLYEKAYELARPENKTVLDLYCGAGTIGLTMAKKAKSVIGVEIVNEAVENARYNAKINGIDNARFICGTASDAAKNLYENGVKADVVIVDPPRKGLDNELIDTISNGFSPERIVYISCDPATFARDLKVFSEYGYTATDVYPFDLFPRTAHIETVVCLSRKDVHERIKFDVNVEELMENSN